MKKKYFELLAKYNRETNGEMNDIIKTLSEEEWNKEFTGFYKSVHKLCSHLFIGDYLWISRLRPVGNYKSLAGDYFNKTNNFVELLFSNINEYIMKRSELDEIIVNFVNEIIETDLPKTITFVNNKGVTFTKRMDVMLLNFS